MLYLVPIEPLVERYTESWYRNIPLYFSERDKQVTVIDGHQTSNTINVGTFLDINSTVIYKNSQLIAIARKFQNKEIKDNDIFFFYDLEFWGIESVRLLAQMNNVKIFIYGFLHAASYTTEDAFSIASSYQKYTELGWLAVCDKVFVGSKYHKNIIVERRLTEETKYLADKIRVTGNPLFASDYDLSWKEPKREKLVISNRFDYEKRPNLSLDFAYILKRRNPTLEIAITTSRKTFRSNKNWLVEYAREMERDNIVKIYEGLTKEQYHNHLRSSKVMLSNTIEESFGYCVVEACLFGCCPLVENNYSHPEILENYNDFLFNDMDEIIEKAEFLLYKNIINPIYYGAKYFNHSSGFCSMANIYKEIFGVYL